jgi:transcriptional accessory protein Tex/SPT6
LIAKPELIEKVDMNQFQTATVGVYTLSDILEELRKPGAIRASSSWRPSSATT